VATVHPVEELLATMPLVPPPGLETKTTHELLQPVSAAPSGNTAKAKAQMLLGNARLGVNRITTSLFQRGIAPNGNAV
jgi:hypothetical protein